MKEDNTLLSGSEKIQGASSTSTGAGRKQRPMLKGLHSLGSSYRGTGTKLSPVSEETVTQDGIFE